ncbi:hypothetical protein PAXRUDRAFT_177669 [Paxillus rubicundulus Ve08.2h10]|uniref:Uncharacterized protein n=1 Tax=Paxillus rubicundulus Ve08.2h10 TaxID=930991 RepID=A0A0D0D1F6_9AGAM|nr:hypothetical protein PAXRUDRAFT_177669 [Paxillus rubicundulus Ve08.2h10]
MDGLCGDVEAGPEESQGPEDWEESQQEIDDKESLTQAARKPRTQKMSSCIAVQAAQGLPQDQEADGANSEDQFHSQKWKEAPHGQGSAKDDWAGIGDWADKLTPTKALAVLSQCSTSNSHHTRSVSSLSLSSLIKGCNITPTSISTCVSAPRSLPPSDPQDSNLYIHGNDEAEHNAMSNPTVKAVTTWQGIAEIVSSSELDELSPPPPPTPKSCIPYKKGSTKGPTTQQAPRLKGKWSMKQTQSNQPDDDSDRTPAAPPLKRAKTAPRSTSGTLYKGRSPT